jgi:hypothetical protein
LLNPLDADLLGAIPVPRVLKKSRLKEWQAFQFGNDSVYVNVALFNAKVLALAQVKIYDRVRKEKALFERKLPPWSLHLPDNLLHSESSYRKSGVGIRFRNRLSSGTVAIEVDIDATASTPALFANLVADHSGVEPMVVSIPFGRNHGMYSHKALMPVEGELQVGENRHVLTRQTGYMFMDDHKGYYPVAMQWDWLAAGGHVDGRLIGFNLTRNQSLAPEQYNENCLWIDGARHLLPAVTFERIAGSPDVWKVRDSGGRVDLDFTIEMRSTLNINAVILRSKYRGPFGYVSGLLRPEGGPETRIDGLFGMAEDFYLRC